MSQKNSSESEKLSIPQREEKILEFWEKNAIFEKSIQQREHSPRFVFYDGPPFATGLPHYGHILASTIKDMVPRYWTMKGYRVDRRWGWDCHGLPIETLVEQELDISGRKAIEKLGIEKFNEAARSKVLAYDAEWYKTVRRIGRFIDFKNSYKTMDPTYMESVWWAFAALFKKQLVYKDFRTSLFCPRCETPLSNFEIAMDNSYRDQEDDSVYVKLPLKDAKNEFLLVWTTTPWTFPGNAAVAVNSKIEYTKYKVEGHGTNGSAAYVWSAVTPPHELGEPISVIERRPGKTLVGKSYEPVFRLVHDKNAYKVVAADFVATEEGTGLVHIAPAFGEEDFSLGKKEHLPMIQTLDDTGRFTHEYREIGFLNGKKTAEANHLVIEALEQKKFLWKVVRITHRYPICWRCQTPLIYKVQPAWFVKVAAIKKDMLALNEKIDWHPEHLKHGRFSNGLETAPDWNVSRSRFWGTPIPIWECAACNKIHVVSSREEFARLALPQKNQYIAMRHGESTANVKNIMSRNGRYSLSLKGKTQAIRTAKKLKQENFDLIISSSVLRAKETAEIVAKEIGIKHIEFDERLNEVNFGIFEGKSAEEYRKFYPFQLEKFSKSILGGETASDVRKRALNLLSELEKKYSGKKILLVSHELPIWVLVSGALGLANEEAAALPTQKRMFIGFAETRPVVLRHVPRNRTGELDFHRPYVDEVPLHCNCGGALKRVPDVFDCWFESGSMPYAEKHYPFENKEVFEKNFPADFISEYIAQTRGWFYTLHVLAAALFKKPAFQHVVTTGTIFSEKGEKLSKSRKNFPDPWLLFERFGVDAIRYYLMSSAVMLADNVNFSEKDVDEIYKKYILIAVNVLNFFKLHQHQLPKKRPAAAPKQVLDRWIMSRLHSVIAEITEAHDAYEIVRATRPLLDFLQDLSLWYVRRSRERVKSDSPDAKAALQTLATVLFEFSRLTAPVTPFLAEMMYQDLGRKKKESVHLEDWPKADKRFIDKKLEQGMTDVRNVVSQALRARAQAGIKVRQPLASLKLQKGILQMANPELLSLIQDEVNVKEVRIEPKLSEPLVLDTAITPELKEEGMMREIGRNIQELRKDLGLRPQHVIRLQLAGVAALEEIVAKWAEALKKDVHAKELKIGGKKVFDAEQELDLEGAPLWIGVKRL